MSAYLCGKSRLLVGGLLCLFLAVPGAAHALPPRLEPPPEDTVKRLEAAVRAGNAQAIRAVLREGPDNLGREELLASLALARAQDELKAAVAKKFGPGLLGDVDGGPQDFRIAIVSKTKRCGVVCMKLRVSWKKEGPKGRFQETAREVPCFVAPDSLTAQLVLPAGLSSAEESRLTIDSSRDCARICSKTAREVREGKYRSVEEVQKALLDGLGSSEAFKKLLRFGADQFAQKLVKAIKEGLKKAFKPGPGK